MIPFISMSISDEVLTKLFAAEGLDSPGILPWPMSGKAEQDRLQRETAFAEGLGSNPPAGLDWIRSHAAAKYRPDRILEGCRSVLITALGYYREDEIDRIPSSGSTLLQGRIARYARGRDYHKELGNRLKRIARKLEAVIPGNNFKSFTDIGPLDETWLAEASGLGFKGRHTLTILPRLGSWVVLGHIISTHPFLPRSSLDLQRCPDGCRRCIDACPTGALSLPGRLNASRCISYYTIEHKGPLGKTLEPENTGDRIFGCDACQEVCPFNARTQITQVEAFKGDIAGAGRELDELLSLRNREDILELFAGSPLMRAGRDSLVRNACTAAGNSGDISLLPALLDLLNDGSQGVREQASWAVDCLQGNLH